MGNNLYGWLTVGVYNKDAYLDVTVKLWMVRIIL